MAVKNPKFSLFLSVEFIVAVPSLRLYGMWQLVAWYLGTFASTSATAFFFLSYWIPVKKILLEKNSYAMPGW
jgi:hypothetical protein